MLKVKQIRSQKRRLVVIVNNQNGIALILALIMLFILSLLGAFAISTSTTELSIAGNQRRGVETFYAADAGLQRAETDGTIYQNIGPTPVITPPAYTIQGRTVDARVEYVGSGNLPVGMGDTDMSAFRAEYFIVSAKAAGSNTEVEVESQTARLVPN